MAQEEGVHWTTALARTFGLRDIVLITVVLGFSLTQNDRFI